MENKDKTPLGRWRLNAIFSAVGGLILITLFFILMAESDTVELVRPDRGISVPEVMERADSFFDSYKLSGKRKGEYRKKVSSSIDKALFRYAQTFKQETGRFPDLPSGEWTIEWTDPELDSMGKRHMKDVFSVSFDFDGRLTGLEINTRNLRFNSPGQSSEEDAYVKAAFFLELQGIDTKNLVTAKKDFKGNAADIMTYGFEFKTKVENYPHVTEIYRLKVTGGEVVFFDREYRLDRNALGWNKDRNRRRFAYILLVIIWLFIILMVLMVFLKKLRRDELEFRHALWVGSGLAVLVGVAFALNVDGLMTERLMLGAFLMAVVIIAILILHPVVSAVSREIWPEKLEVSDLFFQFRGAVRETGAGILYAFLLSGLTVFIFAISVYIFTFVDLGTVVLSSDMLGSFRDIPNALILLFENLMTSLMIGLLFLGFWPAFLRRIFPDRPVLLVFLLALTYDFAGLHLLFFQPTLPAAILAFPVALIWAYAVYRSDLFTVVLSLIGTSLLLDLALLFHVPGAAVSFQGMAFFLVLILLFGLGCFLVYRRQSVCDFDVYVPEYVNRIAERERFLKELEIARGVQMRFLPQSVPQSPNLEIVSLCKPAMEVGGDYFDFIRIDDRYMTVLIGDVSGKGVSAAFYMTMVKGIIKTLSKKTLEPATLLAEANEIFYENAPREVFITIIYGIFDLKKKTLTLASAGHNPLIVWSSKTRKTEMYNPRGVALGLTRGEKYRDIIEERVVEFDDKDIFVFYTDGVSEAMNTDDEVFGEDRLRKVVERYAHLSPQQIQERIVEAVGLFSGKAPQHDDFTMVVVKVRPE